MLHHSDASFTGEVDGFPTSKLVSRMRWLVTIDASFTGEVAGYPTAMLVSLARCLVTPQPGYSFTGEVVDYFASRL